MALRVTRKDGKRLRVHCTTCKCAGALSQQNVTDLLAGNVEVVVLELDKKSSPASTVHFVDPGQNYRALGFMTRAGLIKAMTAASKKSLGKSVAAAAGKKMRIAKPSGISTHKVRP